MEKLTMYWSNICVLKKFEDNALEKLKLQMAQENIELEILHYGIGHEHTMNGFMRTDTSIPDIIISTDLEVFEDKQIYDRIEPQLEDISGWFKIKKDIADTHIIKSKKLLPILVIPMVFCYNKELNVETKNLSIENIVKNNIPLAFGGVNNSGAKCIIKLVLDKYGYKATENFVSRSTITNMPIQSFNNVRKNVNNLALVPTIYAMRADGNELFVSYPADGAPVLPTYVAVKKSQKTELAKKVLKALITKEFCDYYAKTGELYSCIEDTYDTEFLRTYSFKFQYAANIFEQKKYEDFYKIYDKHVLKNNNLF